MPGTELRPRRFAVPRWMRRHTPFLSRILEQLATVNVLDCATRLAAQAFLGAVPALFVIGSLAPDWMQEELVSSLRTAMGLQGAAMDQVRDVYAATGDTVSVGAVGVVVTLLSATAWSRALQTTCERSWHLPKAKARLAAWRWLVWITVWLGAVLFQGSLRDAFGAGPAGGFVLALAGNTLLWWWTQHLLLGGRIPWPPLLPGAVFVACGMQVVSWGSRIYMPHALERSVAQFGGLGSVFVLLSGSARRAASPSASALRWPPPGTRGPRTKRPAPRCGPPRRAPSG